ncbi:MAG: ribosome assembly cofactor RimP [Bacteroidales bacterium]|nr:ribosome assembly cofactor RimP [Bacteroidales bacterium]
MDRQQIIGKVTEAVGQAGCFLVDVTVSKDNDVVIVIEKETGSVDLEDCEAVNDAFLAAFDRDVEDYALTVTSAGLDQPFKVPAQFRKALGTQVEVRLKGGRKLIGELLAADTDGIVLAYTAKEAVEGSKKKQAVRHEDRFPAEEINTVSPHIVFE